MVDVNDLFSFLNKGYEYVKGIIYSESKIIDEYKNDNNVVRKSLTNDIKRKELIIILKLIGTITGTERISVKKLKILSDDFKTKFFRTFVDKESREDTMQFISHIIDQAINLLNEEYKCYLKNKILGVKDDSNSPDQFGETKNIKIIQYQLNSLLKSISSFVGGINNIKNGIYKEDRMFVCFIDTLVEDTIKPKFLEIKEESPELLKNVDFISMIENHLSGKEDKLEDDESEDSSTISGINQDEMDELEKQVNIYFNNKEGKEPSDKEENIIPEAPEFENSTGLP